jgi:Leucine-rich repeat (LRR) protein
MTNQVDNPRATRRPRRRWWQFGIRGLLLLVLVVAIGLFLVRQRLQPYWQQQHVIAVVEELGGTYQTIEVTDWWLSRLGSTHNVTRIDLPDCDDPDAYLAKVADLPAIEILVVGGLAFTDEHAQRLHATRSLRGLVLDSTSVSEEGLVALRAALSEAEVCVSQRRAIAALSEMGEIQTAPVSGTPSPLLKDLGDAWCNEARLFKPKWHFDDCDSELLRAVPSLRELYLHNTEVSDAGLRYLKGLTELEELWLHNTRAGDAALEHIAGMSRLRGLYLSGTQVTDVGLASVAAVSQLQRLDLTDTKLSDKGLAHLAGHGQLEILRLQSTNITAAGLLHVKGLNRLQHLDLQGTEISDAGLAHLRGLTELQELVLYQTQVTDAGLKHLGGLSKLKRLWLEDTGVSEEGLVELRRALPSCIITAP